jgi:Flp pilus assembly protein TadG
MKLRARKGQIIVLVTLLIPVLVGMVGVALDTSNLIAHKSSAQDAADLAALGASGDLPGNRGRARTSGLRFASSNGHANGVKGIAVVVTTPYAGDTTQVEVQVTDTVPIMFMRLFGFTKLVVSARAVATSGAAMQAIYAGGACGGTSPSGMNWSASGSTITGQVHTNGALTISAAGTTFGGPETYVCTQSVTSSGGSIPAPVKVAPVAMPVPFTLASFQPCTYSFTGNVNLGSNGAWWVGGLASSARLNPGTYCATGSITLNTSSVHGTVTFVAGTTVSISGSSFVLQPYQNSVLVYADGTGTSALTASGSTWSGILASPHGTISMTSSGSMMLSGSIMASAVTVNGAGLTLNSTGMTTPKPVLVQ